MSTEIVSMALRRMSASDTTSTVCVEYTTSLIISEDLLKRIFASPIVDEIHRALSKEDNTPHPHVIAIITQPGTAYSHAERALVKVIANWYEEYCGAVDVYNTLQFTVDTSEFSGLIMRPNQHNPRSMYGDYSVRRAMADTLGESSKIPAYDDFLDDLASELGIVRYDTSE